MINSVLGTSVLFSIHLYLVNTMPPFSDPARTRVVNGFQCSPVDYPYLVAIGTKKTNHFCGGSLISSKLVLTAAHCCEDKKFYRVWTGLTRARTLVQSSYVARSFIHPNYSRESPLSTDLCVLELSSHIIENYHTKYVPTVNESTWKAWLAGDMCMNSVAMGFGYQGIKYENGTPADPQAPYNPIMQCVYLGTIPNSECSQTNVDASMICGLDPMGEGRDPCQGDSGGPLICKNVQIGIISAGFGCGLEGMISFFTRVDIFRDYLLSLMELTTVSRSTINGLSSVVLQSVFIKIILS